MELNLHYCGGDLAAVTVALPAPNCCCDADQTTSSECCKDAQLSIQMDIDQANRANPTAEDMPLQALVSTEIMDIEGQALLVIKEIPNFYPNPPPKDGHLRRINMGSLTYYG